MLCSFIKTSFQKMRQIKGQKFALNRNLFCTKDPKDQKDTKDLKDLKDPKDTKDNIHKETLANSDSISETNTNPSTNSTHPSVSTSSTRKINKAEIIIGILTDKRSIKPDKEFKISHETHLETENKGKKRKIIRRTLTYGRL